MLQILLKKEYGVRLSTDVKNAKAKVLDSVYNLPAMIKAKRSKKDLKRRLISDSIERDYIAKASPNKKFLFSNLYWFYFLPIAIKHYSFKNKIAFISN